MQYNNQSIFLHQQVCHLRVVPTLEVPHFSEHKSRAVGMQTPSHLLCQEKTHQMRIGSLWVLLDPSVVPLTKKTNLSHSRPRSTRSLARSHLPLTDKPCTKVNIITRKRGDTPFFSPSE